MNLDELNQRIERWENLRTEFKAWPVHRDKLAARRELGVDVSPHEVVITLPRKRS